MPLQDDTANTFCRNEFLHDVLRNSLGRSCCRQHVSQRVRWHPYQWNWAGKILQRNAAPTGCCCRLGTRGSPPCQNFPRSIELCVKQHALLQHENWLHSTWRPCSASNLQHLSSCCFPTSPSWAPASHRISPGLRETNVQEAPRKKGLRSVGFATVMNSLEFSQVSPHVGRPFFAALSSIPFGTLASPVSKFATSCTSRA